MTSKCGKNKEVAHEAIAECVTDVCVSFSDARLRLLEFKSFSTKKSVFFLLALEFVHSFGKMFFHVFAHPIWKNVL